VVRTAEAGCDGNEGPFDRIRTLAFQFSTRRKACYYAQATFEAPALLVGAEAWDDTPDLNGTKSHVAAGSYPPAKCPFPARSSTLCDPQTAASPPPNPAIPARGCFDAWSATCEPCCDNAHDKDPDCTGKPEGYPGFACTPPIDHGRVSYCSCSCEAEQWTCAC